MRGDIDLQIGVFLGPLFRRHPYLLGSTHFFHKKQVSKEHGAQIGQKVKLENYVLCKTFFQAGCQVLRFGILISREIGPNILILV